jgi:leader peptidase (prepilin peptidase)/N-methyltransferase
MTAVLYICFVATLIALCIFDLRYLRLPDSLNLLLAALGMMRCASVDGASISGALLGAVIAGSLLYIIRGCYHSIRGVHGLGLGDVKLVAAGGLWVEWESIGIVILIASLSACLTLIALARSTDIEVWRKPVPFGPFIVAGLIITWLHSLMSGPTM